MGGDNLIAFPPEGNPNPVVVGFFDRERARVMAGPVDLEARRLMLSRLVGFLKESAAAYGFPWTKLAVPNDTPLVLMCSEQRGGVGLILAIKRLQEEYLTGRASVVVLMRDELNPIPETATETWVAVDSFRLNGGHFELVPTRWLADFEALIRLRRKVAAGELLMPDGTPVGNREVIRFMETGFRSGLLDRLAEILAEAA